MTGIFEKPNRQMYTVVSNEQIISLYWENRSGNGRAIPLGTHRLFLRVWTKPLSEIVRLAGPEPGLLAIYAPDTPRST